MQCIYKIQINDRYYIGSTKNFKTRTQNHLAKLGNSTHHNAFLQNLYNKYGKDSFKFSVIEELEGDIDHQFLTEQKYLDVHFGQEDCVNLCPIASGGFYYVRTPEIIQKQLDTRMRNGNWYAAAGRYPKEAIAANTGSKRDDDFCENMSIIKKKLYEDNPEKKAALKEVAARASKNRWERDSVPFWLWKDGCKYKQYTTQMQVWKDDGVMSQVSISQLFSGKKTSVKGYTLTKD